jgi:serine/threonine protein kinase
MIFWLFLSLIVWRGLTKKVILIAGNFSVDGVQYNIAEFDPWMNSWRENYNSQVYLYSESNSGVVWDVAVNETDSYSEVYAAGLFDTDAKMSQVQLCSVAFYQSGDVDKVGEGMCSRGGDYGPITIQSIVIGNDRDLFVGGSFESRVWDRYRRKFVSMSDVARFDAASSSWLPLPGGGELSQEGSQPASVNTLLWDGSEKLLYLGGAFHKVDNKVLTPNLAVWSSSQGLSSFPGGFALSVSGEKSGEFEILHIFQENISSSLIIVGTFTQLNSEACYGIALWNSHQNQWFCLITSQDMLMTIESASFNQHHLFVSGPLVPEVIDSKPVQTQYGVIYLNLLELTQSLFGEQANISNFNISSESKQKIRRRYGISTRKLKNSEANKKNGGGTNSMQITDSFSPIVPIWNWLPQLPFLSRRILHIECGSDLWQDSLFLALDDETQPGLLAWNFPPRKSGYGNISFIGGHRHAPYGAIHSIKIVNVQQARPPTPSPTLTPPVIVSTDYTYVVVISCIGVGLILGAGIICTCMGYGSVPFVTKPFTKPNNDDTDEIAVARVELGPMPLNTLTDGQNGTNSLDFKETFERAMRTRHLPTYETLVIINPKEILLSRIIGEGSFGRVWNGQWRNNAVAVKEFVFAQAAIAGGSLQRNNIIEEIIGEAGVMACLRHPKILQLYGCSLTMQAIWIVSELCVLGSLKMLLMNPKVDLPLLKRLSMLLDIADGMQYLHNRSPPIIHRDLKSHNIFIQETVPCHFVAKIGDWGSARAVALTGAKSMTQGVGTACWLSPEVINNAHFSKSSDVYAFGIILWEVYTRQEIYEGLSAAQIIAKVAHEGLRPQVPRDCPWSTIMTKCWRQDPLERPNFEKILSSLGKIFIKLTAKLHHPQPDMLSGTVNAIHIGSPASQVPISLKDDVSLSAPQKSPPSNQSSNNSGTKKVSNRDSSRSLARDHSTVPSDRGDVTEETMLLELPDQSNSESQTLSGKPLKTITSATSLALQQQQQTQQNSLSPAMRAGSRGSKYYDSFHPSLENIVTETKTPFSGGRLSQIEESPAHLAPEIVQLEAQGLLTGNDSIFGNASRNNSSTEVGLIADDDFFDEAPDPIDFLFDSHRSQRAASQRKKK